MTIKCSNNFQFLHLGSAQKKQHAAMLHRIANSEDQRQAATDNSAGLTETAVEFVKRLLCTRLLFYHEHFHSIFTLKLINL